MALGNEFVGVLLVNSLALALAVGGVRAALGHALVGLQAAPPQGFHNVSLRARHKALAVGIFDTDNKLAAVFLGKQIVIEGGAQTADM